MSITADNVSTCSFKVPEKFLERTGKERSAWLVSAPHFACELLTVIASFLETTPRKFNVVRNQNITMYLLDNVLLSKRVQDE